MKKLIIYSKYDDYFSKVIRNIKKGKKKVCYVSLNKSYEYLMERFRKEKLALDSFYIIDTITKTLKRSKTGGNVDYIAGPYKLNKISDSIKKAVIEGSELIVFDSLSNLFAYYPEDSSDSKVLHEFLKSFSDLINKKKLDVIFIVRKEDEKNKILQKAISFFKVYQRNMTPLGI